MISRALKISCQELADLLGAKLIGREELLIESVADLETASGSDISFFHNEKYRPTLQRTKAGAIIARERNEQPAHATWLLHENPSLAFQKVIEIFCPKLDTTPYQDIHPTAVIDETASVANSAVVGPHAVIGPRSHIGPHTYIGPGCLISADVIIGNNCLIHPGVIIRESCTLGSRVIVQPGAVIGSCGFGYNTVDGRHDKLDQLGSVVIEDDVEIGAGTCIDRARFKKTRIGRGTKIDNLVMIGHGVEIGPDNLIVAQTGIAGSSKTGRWVVLGGQVGVAGHLELGDGVQVAAQSGVTKNLSSGVYGGSPALPIRKWHESQAHLNSIARLKQQLQSIQEQLQSLQDKFSDQG